MEKDLEILNLTVPTLSIRESKALLAGDGYGWEGPSTYDYDLDLGNPYSIEIHQDFDGHFHIDFNREPIVEQEELEELPTPNVTFEIDSIDVTETISETDIHVADNDSSPSSEQEDDHSHEQDDDHSSFDQDDDHSHDQDDDRDNDRDAQGDDYDINNDARDNGDGSYMNIVLGGFSVEDMLQNAEKQSGASSCVLASIYAILCGYGNIPEGISGQEDIGLRFIRSLKPQNETSNTYYEWWVHQSYHDKFLCADVFSGLKSEETDKILKQYFRGVRNLGNDSDERLSNLQTALEKGPVFGVIDPGDTNNNGIKDDGHAVVIIGYNEDGTLTYWDPDRGDNGEIVTGEVSFIDGWSIKGVRK